MNSRREHLVRCRRELARYAKALMPSPEDASDLLQEVGVVVLAHDDAPADARAFLSWCRAIAHNLALHHWRAARRHNNVFADWDQASDAAAEVPVTAVEESFEDRESLARCVRELDDSSRELLRLKYVDGKTSREIALITRQSPEAVRMRIMRLRDAIRDRLWRPGDGDLADSDAC